MWTVLRFAAYLLIGLVLAYLCYVTWFAARFGIGSGALIPAYVVGLVTCGLLILFARLASADSE